jgi:2-polyprenyl-3-methyl-5-hydroxy-6-metoxy-1,4-benzoquinol methylase
MDAHDSQTSNRRDQEKDSDTSMGEYDGTPSFYTTEETFEKYLGQTSHYLSLQDALVDLVASIESDRILEMGSGTGQTAIRLAEEYPTTEVRGIDNRESVIDRSQSAAADRDCSNLTFETAEMVEYVQMADSLPELVVFLHSFHHIPDPLQQKIDFLNDCYATVPDGGHICIGEAFLQTDARGPAADRDVRTQWADRGLESYASTFWSALDGLSASDIEHAQEVGQFSREHELEAGENVRVRDEEYLISMNWLIEHARGVGFEVVLAEPVNSLGDGIVLLRK